jgi:hypothetical protein
VVHGDSGWQYASHPGRKVYNFHVLIFHRLKPFFLLAAKRRVPCIYITTASLDRNENQRTDIANISNILALDQMDGPTGK